MNKKILIGIVAVLAIIAVVVLVSFSRPNSKSQETGKPAEQKDDQASKDELNKSLDSMAESLKSTCAEFLQGDLSGDPKVDCPGFEKSINQSLCLYCYAIKDNNPSMCNQINNDMALRSICQKATGMPVDNLDSQ